MANLQVKSIDDELYRALGRRAVMENRSISQEVIAILKAYLSTPSNQIKGRDQAFLELCGDWVEDISADELVKDIRQQRETRADHRDISF